MANHLDLEEQEQLDQLKAFWKQYGNAITWVLTLVLGLFAAWNLYQRWQEGQASQASAMYDELERVVLTGDLVKLDRVFSDLKDKYPNTTYGQQGGLLSAKAYFDAGKVDQAKASLAWVVDKASDEGYKSIAKLRLAGVLLEAGAFDDAMKLLAAGYPVEFEGLVADRKGDILMLQGKKVEAKAEFEKAFKAFDERTEYRRLVEVKLSSLGVNTRPEVAPASLEGKN